MPHDAAADGSGLGMARHVGQRLEQDAVQRDAALRVEFQIVRPCRDSTANARP